MAFNVIPKTTQFYSTAYQLPSKKKEDESHDCIISGSPFWQIKNGTETFTKAVTTYTKSGFTGNKNHNFYEFLSLGVIPYTIGSLTLMGVFNCAAKYFEPFEKMRANKVGHKMALGVVLYGLMKYASKKLIEAPVHAITGIDPNIRYRKVVSELPTMTNLNPTKVEYHKVFESVDFPRWDLLHNNPNNSNEHSNAYFDKVAKRLGVGTNLPDSDQIVQPIIKETITKTRAWSTVSSYLWAAVGVATAVQNSFGEYFQNASRLSVGKKITEFFPALKDSVKDLWKGATPKTGVAGKVLVSAAVLSTVLGVLCSTMRTKDHNASIPSTALIDDTRKVTEC